MYNPDSYLVPMVRSFVFCQQIAFCSFVALLIFPTLLADVQIPNKKSAHGPQPVVKQSFNPCPLLSFILMLFQLILRGNGVTIMYMSDDDKNYPFCRFQFSSCNIQNHPININLLKVPKVVKPTNKKTLILKLLGIVYVLNSPISPPSLHSKSDNGFGYDLPVYCKYSSLILINKTSLI